MNDLGCVLGSCVYVFECICTHVSVSMCLPLKYKDINIGMMDYLLKLVGFYDDRLGFGNQKQKLFLEQLFL